MGLAQSRAKFMTSKDNIQDMVYDLEQEINDLIRRNVCDESEMDKNNYY